MESQTGKMLRWLKEFYSKKPDEFKNLLPVRGRGRGRSGGKEQRVWIASTPAEIAMSGKSTKPREIAGKDGISVWVATNGSDPQRAAVVFWVALRLGFASENPEKFAKMVREFVSDVYQSDEKLP